ncbi:MAG: hypothetical protein H6538_03645 [Bacteroidales bacterium]|nr:hypothetical protein [Bacteroidales bacterium]
MKRKKSEKTEKGLPDEDFLQDRNNVISTEEELWMKIKDRNEETEALKKLLSRLNQDPKSKHSKNDNS